MIKNVMNAKAVSSLLLVFTMFAPTVHADLDDWHEERVEERREERREDRREDRREERREDMTDFIQYVNQQMQEDQFTQQMKFKQIEQTLNYQNNLLNSVDIQAKPAIWIEEDTTDE